MAEQRKQTREKITSFMPIYSMEPKVLLGYLGDLNLLGCMVISENKLNPSQETTLLIEFPAKIAVPKVTIPAQVAWCKENLDTGYFNIGFTFKALSSDQTQILQTVTDNYQFRQDMPK